MKLVLWTAFLLAVCSAGQGRELPELGLSSALLEDSAPAGVAPNVVDLPRVDCRFCIAFFDDTLNEMLKIIAQFGIAGSCEELCGLLANPWAESGCTLFCTFKGLEEFSKLILTHDITPIALCADLDVCPRNTCDRPCITNLTVSIDPPIGPAGTKFAITANFFVESQTGVGNTAFEIANYYEGGGGTIDRIVLDLNEGFAPGRGYSVTYTLETAIDKRVFIPERYDVTAYTCQLACGFGGDTRGYVYGMKFGSFNISETELPSPVE